MNALPLTEYNHNIVTKHYEVLQDILRGWGVNNFSFFILNFVDESINQDSSWDVTTVDIESPVPLIEGQVVFFADSWRFGENAKTEVLTNPTWKDMIIAVGGLISRSTTCTKLLLAGLEPATVNNNIKHIKLQIDHESP